MSGNSEIPISTSLIGVTYSCFATMKRLGLLVYLFASVTAASQRDHTDLPRRGRVVGGVDAIPHEFPSIVSIQRLILTLSTHWCGGSILTPGWILTAAHCITEAPDNARFAIWAGSHDITVVEVNRQIINVAESIMHPEYDGGFHPSDVAVMRLVRNLNFNDFVQPAILQPAGTHPEPGPATLAGWGSTSTTTVEYMPDVLQKVTKPIISFEACKEANADTGRPLGEANICTGPLTGGISGCFGDSGGPLYVIENGVHTQVGIASWAWNPCGTVGRPTVYVGVSHHRDWIDAQIT